jgi:hypothetical protein
MYKVERALDKECLSPHHVPVLEFLYREWHFYLLPIFILAPFLLLALDKLHASAWNYVTVTLCDICGDIGMRYLSAISYL